MDGISLLVFIGKIDIFEYKPLHFQIMTQILTNLWKGLKEHQKVSIQIAALFTPIAYVILLLYAVEFLNTDIWNRLICSTATSSFTTLICGALWGLYRLPSERYAPLTAFILSVSTLISIFLIAVPDIPTSCLAWISNLLKAPWSPLVVFLALAWMCNFTLYRKEQKHKNIPE